MERGAWWEVPMRRYRRMYRFPSLPDTTTVSPAGTETSFPNLLNLFLSPDVDGVLALGIYFD